MRATISKENIRHIKRAYLIFSPESTGNKMLDKAMQSSNDFGRGGTTGNLYKSPSDWNYNWVDDDINDIENVIQSIETAPDKVLMTCSIPRKPYPGKDWIPIERICWEFFRNGYKIFPLMVVREEKYTILSQVRRGHAPNEKVAKELLYKSYEYIKTELGLAGLKPIEICYEAFAEEKDYRDFIFEALLLQPPDDFEFFNANKLHYKDENGNFKYNKRIRK